MTITRTRNQMKNNHHDSYSNTENDSNSEDSEFISEETQKYDLQLKIEKKLNKIVSNNQITFKDIDDLKLFKKIKFIYINCTIFIIIQKKILWKNLNYKIKLKK